MSRLAKLKENLFFGPRKVESPNLEIGEIIVELFKSYPSLNNFSFRYEKNNPEKILINNLPLPLGGDELKSWLVEVNFSYEVYEEILPVLQHLSSWFCLNVSFSQAGVQFEK